MRKWYSVEWSYKREDGLIGSDSRNYLTIDEVDKLVESIKTNPYRTVLECWVIETKKII